MISKNNVQPADNQQESVNHLSSTASLLGSFTTATAKAGLRRVKSPISDNIVAFRKPEKAKSNIIAFPAHKQQQAKAPSLEEYNPLNNPWIMPTVPMVGLAAMCRLFANRQQARRRDEEATHTNGYRAR